MDNIDTAQSSTIKSEARLDRNLHMLWLDLETTGTDPERDNIIEVGAILTLDGDEVSTYNQVYRPEVSVGDVDPYVLNMHGVNGLWEEIWQAYPQDAPDYLTAPEDEDDILKWLGENLAFRGGPLPLAGSGVSHFDRRFVRSNWPKLDKRLAYAMYDIGVVRRFLREWGFEYLVDRQRTDSAGYQEHRALEDARAHMEEALFYQDALLKLSVQPGEPTVAEAKERNDEMLVGQALTARYGGVLANT